MNVRLLHWRNGGYSKDTLGSISVGGKKNEMHNWRLETQRKETSISWFCPWNLF